MGTDSRDFRDVHDAAPDGLLTPEEQRLALGIARITLERYLGEGETPPLEALGLEGYGVFNERRAVFVTLHKGEALRGCIGHIEPVESLWRSIRSNAVSAAVHDRRFAPVTLEELAELSVEVSVLTPPVPIENPLEFEVGRDGVILELGHYRSVFLPQVALEQGWDQPTTLGHLSRKAGLDPEGWRKPGATFKVFRAQILN